MPNFFVDPLLCTTPPDTDSPEDFGEWLKALKGWLDAVEASPFPWKNAIRCTEKLVELGRFPHFDSLRHMTAASKVDVNVSYLLQRVNRFFQNEANDLHLEIPTQVALSETEPKIEPIAFVGRNIEEIRTSLAETLVCLALDKSRNDEFALNTRIVTRPFATGDESISVNAQNVEVDPPNIHEARIENSFPVLFSPQDLTNFRYESLLEGGEPSFAIAVSELVEETFPGVIASEFSVGSHFWRSWEATAMLQDRFVVEKALKICAAIVVGRHDDLDLHRRPVRKSAAPDSDQKTRSSDKAKAWRISITRHGAGYRLQYWAIPKKDPKKDQALERIEFANVAREQDSVFIPE